MQIVVRISSTRLKIYPLRRKIVQRYCIQLVKISIKSDLINKDRRKKYILKIFEC